MDEFQDLLTQSGQVLTAKTFNRCGILLVGLGGPTLMKKTMKGESGVFPCHGMAASLRLHGKVSAGIPADRGEFFLCNCLHWDSPFSRAIDF